MYSKMLFRLMNFEATFQREMDIAFTDEKGKFVLIYLDDITIISKTESAYLKHLRTVFTKCRKFRVSLNLKKISFRCEGGKIVGSHSIKGEHSNRS